MNTLRERLADPHGYRKPLFPKSIAEMSDSEKLSELDECAKALRINVWQSTSQMDAVQERKCSLEEVETC